MATNTFNSLHQTPLHGRHSTDHRPPSTTTTSCGGRTSYFFRKPITTPPLPHLTTFSATPTTTSFDLLHHHLSTKNFRRADEETRSLLIHLAGEPTRKRGYVFFSEAQFIPQNDLKTIDQLWRDHSDNKFGYRMQKKIWEKSNRDFTKFFIKIGWMKRLQGCEVEQYNYRAFPTEFTWEIEDGAPEGHLPLTNAMRGTQLLRSVFTHPAFHGDDEHE